MEILPEQVAHRGFEYGLTVDWIYRKIIQSVHEGILERPVHVLKPSSQSIPIRFSTGLVVYWKQQFERGNRIKIPRELWDDIDRILGVEGMRTD